MADRNELGLRPSLTDRLFNPVGIAKVSRLGYDQAQARGAVLADLEHLLNTRRPTLEIDPALAEVPSSVMAYGIKDLVSMNAHSEKQLGDIGDHIRLAIERFEPRLKEVAIHFDAAATVRLGEIRYRIEAKMAIEPYDPVYAETILHIASGACQIKEQDPKARHA